MSIKILNFFDKQSVNISLPLITGEILAAGDSEISVQNTTCQSGPVIWPVVREKFKILVSLRNGENEIRFQHKNTTYSMTLVYEPLQCKKFVRLVYIKCKNDDGAFQAPPEEANSIQSACKRISLAGQMLQTFTYDKLGEHGLASKTFCLEEHNGKVACNVFTSSLSLEEAYALNEDDLWSHFAVELMNSSLRVDNDCKFLAFLSFTKYLNESKVLPSSHREILQMTKGHVALGGGGLALFGSGCLHTWPQTVQEIPWRFGDKRKIDRLLFMDDSRNRGWYWSCYSTGLGAALHELGHTFDLGHTNDGIMARGFDDIHKFFIIDMFYHDHIFQKKYNPFYQMSSTHHFVNLSTSPLDAYLDMDMLKLKLQKQSENQVDFQSQIIEYSAKTVEVQKAWKLPDPPDFYSKEKSAVHVGGAYWSRSSALILYFHKWFNNFESTNDNSICFKGTKLSSSNGIRVVDIRDKDSTSIHHLEYLEGDGCKCIDFAELDVIQNLFEEYGELLFLAEDSRGDLFKSKLDKHLFSKES